MKLLQHLLIRPTFFAAFLLVSFVFSTVSAQPTTRDISTLTILADATLAIPVSQIASQYARIEGISISAVYQSPFQHQKNIEDGEPADILITADTALVKKLKDKGLIDVNSPTIIAYNNLDLILPNSSQTSSNYTLKDIQQNPSAFDKYRWVILSPEFFVEGKVAYESIEKNYPLVVKNANLLPLANTIDVQKSVQEPMRIGVIPHSMNNNSNSMYSQTFSTERISYTSVVVASENMKHARKLQQYLISEEARSILKNAGLLLPDTQ